MTARLHASCVLVGERAVLICGASGSGKSALAWALIERAGGLLVADDQTLLEACGGRLLARPAPTLAGLIERRGMGLFRVPHEPVAVVALAVDRTGPLARLPLEEETRAVIQGVVLPRCGCPAAAGDPVERVRFALSLAAHTAGDCAVHALVCGAEPFM